MTRRHDTQILLDASSRITPPEPPETTNAWKRLRNTINAVDNVPAAEERSAGFRWRLPRVAYLAGVLVLVVGIGRVLSLRLSYESFHTGPGEQEACLLPDSSAVRMNQNSELTFHRGLIDWERLIDLRGEAYFNVRSGESPFEISTSVGTVRVVGTEFNVLCKNNRLEVAVNRGIVTVSAGVGGIDSTVRVRKGEMVVCRSGAFPEGPRPIRFEQYPGWLRGKLLVDQMPVPDVCKAIEETSGATIRIEDTTLNTVTVTGVLEGKEARVLIATLCSLTGRQFRYEKGAYVIY